jgi:hypothetical protein
MAVIQVDSDYFLADAYGAYPGRAPNRTNAVLRVLRWSLPATTVEGDEGSLIRMVTLPGLARYLPQLSKMGWKGFGTGRTLTCGWLAYEVPGQPTVAADPAGLAVGLDVSADGRSFFDAFPTSSVDEYVFPVPVTLTLSVVGGTIPVGTSLGGILVYAQAF